MASQARRDEDLSLADGVASHALCGKRAVEDGVSSYL